MIHQKMIDRWALIYVDYLLASKDKAREWSHRFLPHKYVDAVAESSKQVLKKRGYKVLE